MDRPLEPEGFDEESAFAAAKAAIASGAHAKAEERLKAFGLASNHCREALVLMGQALIPQGRGAEALQCAIQAIGLEDGPDARVALAQAHLALREWSEAEAACRAALVLEPNYPTAHLHLGQALLARKLHPQARLAFEAACEALPQNLLAHLGAADAAWALNDATSSHAHWLKAKALAPQDPEVLRRAQNWNFQTKTDAKAVPSQKAQPQSPSGPLGRPSAASAHQAALARLQAKLQAGATKNESKPPA